MAAILSSLPLVTVTDDRATRALAVLQRQTQHMTRSINDLLDVTRVRHGKLRLERSPTEINEAMVSAIETVRSHAESKELRLHGEPAPEPMFVDADPERLAQILDNLLRNALAYTDRGEVVAHVRRENSVARVAIRDTGVGIRPQDIRGLFEAYRRGDGKRTEGLGLGLALVKALVEAHGGTIACQSEGPGRAASSALRFRWRQRLRQHRHPTPSNRPRDDGSWSWTISVTSRPCSRRCSNHWART